MGEFEVGNGYEHAFITGPNGEDMRDLNSLLHMPGWILTYALGINNNGHIVAIAVPEHALTIPESETYALMLAGLGLIGFVAWRQKSGSRELVQTRVSRLRFALRQ